MSLYLDDVVVLRKPHPCGGDSWRIVRSARTSVCGARPARIACSYRAPAVERDIKRVRRARAAGIGEIDPRGLSHVPEKAELGLLRNRAFMALWGAQVLSQTASNAVTSALIILVAELTHSNTSSSFLILLAIIPAVLFGFAGGIIVDRTDRRLVLIVTNALRAAAIIRCSSRARASRPVPRELPRRDGDDLLVPAVAATIPSIVAKKDLLIANSLFTFTFNGAFLFGFIILAPIVVSCTASTRSGSRSSRCS